jgi:hypothetical protein
MATPGVNGPDPPDPLGHLTQEDRALLFRFLGLIRDNYKKADKSAHFLERKAGVTNTCGITNLRDVLSHFATLLDPHTPQAKRRDQIANAEEHLRRAIIEPYEIGLASLTDKFKPTYETYREKVIPIRNTDGFRTAPGRSQIDGRLADIDESAEKGKSAKGKNLWDDDWEDGVAGLIDAFDQLTDLHNEIEDWIFKYRQDHQGHHSVRMHYIAIVVGIVVSIVVGIVIARYTPWLEVPKPDPARLSQPVP